MEISPEYEGAMLVPTGKPSQLTELEVLRQAMSASILLLQRPIDTLLDHSFAISELHETYKRLNHEIQKYESRRSTPISPTLAFKYADPLPISPPLSPPDFVINDITRSINLEHDPCGARIRSLLDAAIDSIPRIHAATERFEIPASNIPVNHRLLHVQNILTLQKRRLSISEASPERVLAICACRSLAMDFHEFERQLGVRPKEDILLERITQSADMHIQTIDKNLSQFLAAKFPGQEVNSTKLESALRLGIKLGLIDSIGRRVNIDCLGLLVGFECAKLTRLPFYALSRLEAELTGADIYGRIRDFDVSMREWWSNCQHEYHARYRAG